MAAGTITCGPNGSTGQQIADTINHMYNAPISRIYSTSTLAGQPITTTASPLVLGNAKQEIRPGIPVGSYSNFTIPNTGYYTVNVNVLWDYDNGEDIIFQAAINGVSPAGNGITLTGKGANSHIQAGWVFIGNYNTNDILTITAKAVTGTGTLTIINSSVIIEAL
jgi:hypothetical protein